MELCIHERKVCYDCAKVSDSAKRAYNIINGYVAFIPHDQLVRSWVAIRLSDGGSDGELYESKRDAVRHQVNEFQCAYFSYRNASGGFGNEKEAQVWLDFQRVAYESGFRLADPDAKDGGRDIIMPVTYEDTISHLAQMGLRNRTRGI